MTQEFVTLPRDVVEQALNSLRLGVAMYPNGGTAGLTINEAINALRSALEQPDTGIPTSVPAGWKPVARVAGTGHLGGHFDWCVPGIQGVPRGTLLYTRPHPRQPLTDEQIDAIMTPLTRGVPYSWRAFARAIEQAHNIK